MEDKKIYIDFYSDIFYIYDPNPYSKYPVYVFNKDDETVFLILEDDLYANRFGGYNGY